MSKQSAMQTITKHINVFAKLLNSPKLTVLTASMSVIGQSLLFCAVPPHHIHIVCLKLCADWLCSNSINCAHWQMRIWHDVSLEKQLTNFFTSLQFCLSMQLLSCGKQSVMLVEFWVVFLCQKFGWLFQTNTQLCSCCLQFFACTDI